MPAPTPNLSSGNDDMTELVAVGVERATATMRRRELGLDLTHPGTAGHRRYGAAFAAALARRT